MTKQQSIITLRGSIDNLNFYKKNGEFRVRRKPSIDKQRILTDPQFARTRENMAQLGLVSGDLKLFSNAISNFKSKTGARFRANQLSALFFRVTRYDDVSERGDKKVAVGIKNEEAINLFRGLALANHSMSQNLSLVYTIDRATCKVTSEEFIPSKQMVYPVSATHFEIQLAVVAIDFANKTHKISHADPIAAQIDDTPLTLSFQPDTMPDPGGDPSYFVMMSLSYFQQDNGRLYQLRAANCLSLDIIDAFNL